MGNVIGDVVYVDLGRALRAEEVHDALHGDLVLLVLPRVYDAAGEDGGVIAKSPYVLQLLDVRDGALPWTAGKLDLRLLVDALELLLELLVPFVLR